MQVLVRGPNPNPHPYLNPNPHPNPRPNPHPNPHPPPSQVKSQLVSLSVQPDGRWREDEATAPAIEGVSVSAVDSEP